MKIPNISFRSILLFLLLNTFVINAYSISISTRRLYLDPNSDSASIRVHNMDPTIQRCEVTIKDVVVTSLGQLALVSENKVQRNSAKPLVRLAPRRFNLGTSEHQMIKLLYRRKPGLENGEYHGVLAIKCVEKADTTDLQVNIIPALVHNVPVIVRTGKMPIQAEFISPTIKDNKLQVELHIQGKRSLTGDVEVINMASGEVIAKQKHVSIYAQQPVKLLELLLEENQNGPVLIKLTENPKMGGDLVIERLIQ